MEHDVSLLKDLIILLLAAVPIGFVFSRLKLPGIVGFMITGVVIGPYGLRLIADVEAINALAEIGIVLLLFVIGLEFSLKRLLEMRRFVLLGGGLQVTITILISAVLLRTVGLETERAIFYGFLFALSSTAIVLKSYTDRAEIDTPHGRSAVGILLFQDICVVPMMLLIPVLSGERTGAPTNIVTSLGTAVVAVAGIILAARYVVPTALFQIVRLRSSEVFISFVVLLILGTSWLTSQLGLSLALGAFIAGLVLSESEYSHQIVSDILPFRDVFNSIFFISIGMLLSLSALYANLLTVGVWIVGIFFMKLVVVLAVMVIFNPLRISLVAAIGLSQVGEFSFVLARAGLEYNLLPADDYQRFLAASIVLMSATPLLIQAAPRIAYAIQSLFTHEHKPGSESQPFNPGGEEISGHVIVVGYGLNGRNLSKVLERAHLPFLVLEINADSVRAAAARGVPIYYGDSTRREVLERAGIEKARLIVLAISDPIATRRTVWLARQMNPTIHIIVRTRYMSEMADLYGLGADEIVPEEFETSLEIFSRVLTHYGIARNVIQSEVDEIRREGYQMLRSPSLPLMEMGTIARLLESASTQTCVVEPGSTAEGKTIGDLRLRTTTGASVLAVLRNTTTEVSPGPDFELAADDIVVLLGSFENTEKAIEYLRAPLAGKGEAEQGVPVLKPGIGEV